MEIVPKDIRITNFGIEEKTNIIVEGVAKDDRVVVNMMDNFSQNITVNDSRIEAMIEFTDQDRIVLYSEEGKAAPKMEEIPQENITKKFNSRLSLKPLENEIFDNEKVVAALTKKKK